MNLYNLHNSPESLKHHDAAHEKIVNLAWDKFRDDGSELRKRESLWAQDADKAFMYAVSVLDGQFKKGEKAIISSPYHARMYAKYIMKGEWPEAEDSIATSAIDSLVYATEVLEGPFPKGEKTLLNSRYKYAYEDFKRRNGWL